jgi:hypothetical protein
MGDFLADFDFVAIGQFAKDVGKHPRTVLRWMEQTARCLGSTCKTWTAADKYGRKDQQSVNAAPR